MVFKLIEKLVTGIVTYAKEIEEDNSGIGVVEVILILVVLIGLVVIFRDQLTTIVNGIFTRITNDANGI